MSVNNKRRNSARGEKKIDIVSEEPKKTFYWDVVADCQEKSKGRSHVMTKKRASLLLREVLTLSFTGREGGSN